MAREIVPDVFEVLFPRALVHAFVVRADVPTVIDTGLAGSTQSLVRALADAGVAEREVARILVTHAHADHAGGVAELARRSGAEVHGSAATAALVSEGRQQAKPRAATPLGRLMVPYVSVALPWQVAQTEVQPSLVAGAQIGPFTVIDTPGHQLGHVSLLWKERGILFTADAAAHLTRVGPHPAAQDPGLARQSYERLRGESFDTACFGHGRAIVGAQSRF